DQMSSTCDASSGVFSMHSHAMTRASTATNATEHLITPMDERKLLKTSQSGVGGPRKMDAGNQSRSHAGLRTVTSSLADRHYEAYPRQPEEHESSRPYVPIGPNSTMNDTTPRRHQSTRQLISRYESMAGTSPGRLPRSSAGAALAAGRDDVSSAIGASKGKRRSLSNSLRNFISVFKKGRGKDRDSDGKENSLAKLRSLGADDAAVVAQIPTAPDEAVAPQAPMKDVVAYGSAHSSALCSGTLLYLSRPSSPIASPILPVWTMCTVTLHASHILITWYTIHGNPSTHVIPLAACTDVRSLALAHLGHDEKALLPAKADGEDLKVFEILFEGCPRERFAAPSAQERARWVSATWDAILRSQEHREPSPVSDQDAVGNLTIMTDVAPRRDERSLGQPAPISASEYTDSEYTSSSVVETESLFAENGSALANSRALPPTPIAESPLSPAQFPARVTLRDSPRAQSTNPPMHLPPETGTGSSTSSRSKSPSIAKLGNLSVVKQRLAEMERTHSGESTVTVSSALTHLRRAQTTRSSRVRNAFAEIEKMQEEDEDLLEDTDTRIFAHTPLATAPSPIRSDSSRSRSAFRRTRQNDDVLQESSLLPPSSIQEDTEHAFSASHDIVEPDLAPLAELIKDNAAKHYDQTAGLGEQIIALQRDIHNLPTELRPLISDIVRLEPSRDGKDDEGISPGIAQILSRLDDIRKQTTSDKGPLQLNSIAETLGLVQTQLKSDIPEMLAKLDVIQKSGILTASEPGDSTTQPLSLNNLQPSRPIAPGQGQSSPTDLSDIYAKLEELAAIYKPTSPAPSSAGGGGSEASPCPQDDGTSSDKLQVVLDYLKTDEAQRKVQLEQQADSVRYLNELNSWLDAFVNNGTAQIQSVATGVEHLCKQLGCGGTSDEQGDGVLGEIRQQLSVWKTHQQNADHLQVSVENLIQAVQGHLTNGAEERTTLELTNEIRGERLRFVEAMKEATAINVQAHVEHFKAELGREVMVMTQDVGRLHKEKQAIEQQIADLFAFYSKQKQEAEVSAPGSIVWCD
ncbi:hypothetical protein BV22DRAFT_1007527, partial [Leucogyrophana mollusca]